MHNDSEDTNSSKKQLSSSPNSSIETQSQSITKRIINMLKLSNNNQLDLSSSTGKSKMDEVDSVTEDDDIEPTKSIAESPKKDSIKDITCSQSSSTITISQLVEEFRCAISHQIMRDPVFTSDGETYEREEIERWLKNNQTSPSTNVRLPDKTLKPNIALKKAINTFLEQHPEYIDEVYFSKAMELSFIESCKSGNSTDSEKDKEAGKELKKLISQEKRLLGHRFDRNETALHIAARYGSYEIVRTVVKCMKSANKGKENSRMSDAILDTDGHGWNVLHYACYCNSDIEAAKELIRILIKEETEDNRITLSPLSEKQRLKVEEEGVLDSHFLQSVKDDNLELLDVFLNLGANIEARDSGTKYKGGSALHIATSRGSKSVVEFLLRRKANIHARTGTHPCDFAAIHFAARGGHHDVIEVLLDNGADIDMKCNPNGCSDWTALHLSSRNGRTSVVETLIRRGANVNALGDEERLGIGKFSPFYLAVIYGHMEEAGMLLDAGATIDGVDHGLVPLLGAVKHNQLEIVHMLLKKGANINAHDYQHKTTALHIAAAHGYVDIAKLLVNFQFNERFHEIEQLPPDEQLKRVIDVNAEDKRGNTPLHDAAHNGQKEIVSVLLSVGANWKAKNLIGKTPVEEAVRNGKREVAEEIQHEVKKLKALKIQFQRPLLHKIHNQEIELKKQSELIAQQQQQIDILKQQIEQINQLLRK